MQPYAHHLNYDFTAKVDSSVIVNEKKVVGFIVGSITSGSYDKWVEDSLNRNLINYKRIVFNF